MDPILVTIIVTVIVFGGALTAGYFVRAGIRNVKRKIQSSLLGQIYNGINRDLSEKNMSITDVDFIPKAGAKSVSDMSSALVPLISRDFPELNFEQL